MARAAVAPKGPSEYDFHRSVIFYLTKALDGHAMFFHSPNGGYRYATEAARLKSMGVIAGLPDIGIVHAGRVAFLELKAKRGRVSPAQAYCHQRLLEAGSTVSVCRTLSDVEAALKRAGIPVKARVML